MNRKGFTLIEGMMVIAIIGMLLLILVPNVLGIIEKNKVSACEDLKESIISTAKLYASENKYDLFKNGTTTSISVNDLKTNGYLKNNDLKNPLTGEDIKGKNVEISYSSGNFTVDVDIDCDTQ